MCEWHSHPNKSASRSLDFLPKLQPFAPNKVAKATQKGCYRVLPQEIISWQKGKFGAGKTKLNQLINVQWRIERQLASLWDKMSFCLDKTKGWTNNMWNYNFWVTSDGWLLRLTWSFIHDLPLDLLPKEMTFYQRTRDLKMCNFVWDVSCPGRSFRNQKNIGRASRTTEFPTVFCSEKASLNFIIPWSVSLFKWSQYSRLPQLKFENHGFVNLNVLQEGFPQPRRTGEAPARSPERQIWKKKFLLASGESSVWETQLRIY